MPSSTSSSSASKKAVTQKASAKPAKTTTALSSVTSSHPPTTTTTFTTNNKNNKNKNNDTQNNKVTTHTKPTKDNKKQSTPSTSSSSTSSSTSSPSTSSSSSTTSSTAQNKNEKKRKAEEIQLPSSTKSKKAKKSKKDDNKPDQVEIKPKINHDEDDLAVSSDDDVDVDTNMVDVEAKEDEKMQEEQIPLPSSDVAKKSKPSKVVCMSRLPFGMEENQLREFLAQFGKIDQVRVSRNRITGKSRGYAFIQFHEPVVAQIVADTLHDYFFGIRRLHCRIVPTEKVHADLFKPIPLFKENPRVVSHRVFNAKMKDDSEEAVEKRQKNLLTKQKKLAKKLRDLNISYTLPSAVTAKKRMPTLKQMKRRPALKYNLSQERALLALSGKPYFRKE
eukprot:TRINITY_DN2724_c1_g1_i3.p1 TRINITY_DN2724_c1_g1~~TRINITY_DN2724_c1_g1_i3.p1  ORF type:complete len:390 (-),score=156.55 TRINITY_DN2724_c1_g1_i3:29-1198(-)